jgi:hypothetical protein
MLPGGAVGAEQMPSPATLQSVLESTADKFLTGR